MVTGLQFLALACSSEYSWQTHQLSAFVDVKVIGGTQSVLVSANAPHPTREQGTGILHPSSSRFAELECTIERDEEMARVTYQLPDGHSSILIHKMSPYTGHNSKPLDIPLDEESRHPRDRRIIKRLDNSYPKQKHRRSTTGPPASPALTKLNEPSI